MRVLREFISLLLTERKNNEQRWEQLINSIPKDLQDAFWFELSDQISLLQDDEIVKLKHGDLSGFEQFTIKSLFSVGNKIKKNLKKDIKNIENGPFEKIAFSSSRSKTGDISGEYEHDNKLEQLILDELSMFFEDNEDFDLKRAKLLQRLLIQGKYSDVIKRPSAKFLYRGLNKKETWRDSCCKT